MTFSLESLLTGFIGGCLIGLGSLLGLAVSGKVPGISGVFARLLKRATPDKPWRILFLAGLIAGAFLVFCLGNPTHSVPGGRTWPVYVAGGLLVGFGTRIGGGCTSGHGVCGIGAGARDSLVATLVFMTVGAATVAAWNVIFSAS